MCTYIRRAEAYASKNGPISSIFDGLGQGLGFTLALFIVGFIRELLGTGKILGNQLIPKAVDPALIFILAPGAFITLGILMAIMNQRKLKKSSK